MLIDSWNISEANARQWNATYGFSSFSNDSEWVKGSISPFFSDNKIGFKPLTLVLMVKGNNRDEILNNSGLILSKLRKKVTLTLDGRTHKYVGILDKSSLEEKSLDNWHKLKLEFSGYEIGDLVTQTFSNTKSIQITNPGTIETPVKVVITPTIGSAKLRVDGLGSEIVIPNTTLNKAIELDGRTGLFTEGGAIKKDLEIWSLPHLNSGVNTVTFSEFVNVTVEFNPYYV